MKTDLVKGFNDFTGENALKRAEIKNILVSVFEKYGFQPVETPVIEYRDFVKGENQEDEAISDIFKLNDKGKRSLALRYEFTFQLKRIAKNKKLPYKRYQIGEVFRDEPTKVNRSRQFTQCDVDIIGSSVKDEAEILALAKESLYKLGIKPIILINNRKLLNEILEELRIKDKRQVIREIDKLDKLPEKEILKNLKKYKAEKIMAILKKKETYFEKYNSYSEIKELKKYCKYYGIDLVFSPFLARGLSYYNGNIFEIKTPKSKETICAGGSYKINGVQGTGISFGLDRLSLVSKIKIKNNNILIISLNQDKESIKLAQKLRDRGENAILFYGKPSKALEYANSYKIEKVIFVGKEEVKKGKFKVKDMKTGKEELKKEEQI